MQEEKKQTKGGLEQIPNLATLENKKKTIKASGTVAVVFGGLILLINLAFYIARFFTNLNEFGIDLSMLVLTMGLMFLFVLFGFRIKKLNDKNTPTYLTILLVLSIVFFSFSIFVFGNLSYLWLLCIVQFILGLVAWKKLQENSEFNNKIIKPEYKFRKKHWIIFSLVFILLFVGSFFLNNLDYADFKKINLEEHQKVKELVESKNSWQPISEIYSKGEFTVLLPNGNINVDSDSLLVEGVNGSVQMDVYNSYDSENYSWYAVSVFKYPESTIMPSQVDALNGSLASMLEIEGNELVSSELIDFDGLKALKYVIDGPDKDGDLAHMQGMHVLDGNKAYHLIIVAKPDKYIQADWDKFFESFKLLK